MTLTKEYVLTATVEQCSRDFFLWIETLDGSIKDAKNPFKARKVMKLKEKYDRKSGQGLYLPDKSAWIMDSGTELSYSSKNTDIILDTGAN